MGLAGTAPTADRGRGTSFSPLQQGPPLAHGRRRAGLVPRTRGRQADDHAARKPPRSFLNLPRRGADPGETQSGVSSVPKKMFSLHTKHQRDRVVKFLGFFLFSPPPFFLLARLPVSPPHFSPARLLEERQSPTLSASSDSTLRRTTQLLRASDATNLFF